MGDQERLLADRLRALRPRGVPRDEDDVEDRQGDGWQEDGGAALPEVERDGGDQVRAAAAVGGGHVQELRGLVPHRVPGWQRRCHAWQDRQEDGQDRGRQGQEVSSDETVVRMRRLVRLESAAWVHRKPRETLRVPLPLSFGTCEFECDTGSLKRKVTER